MMLLHRNTRHLVPRASSVSKINHVLHDGKNPEQVSLGLDVQTEVGRPEGHSMVISKRQRPFLGFSRAERPSSESELLIMGFPSRTWTWREEVLSSGEERWGTSFLRSLKSNMNSKPVGNYFCASFQSESSVCSGKNKCKIELKLKKFSLR